MSPPPYVQTRSGRRVHLLRPDPADLELSDIALGLSRTARFNGQTDRFYSVAEHSVRVSNVLGMFDSKHLPEYAELWGLMHDAAEAYLGDVVGPLKALLPTYQGLEAVMMRAVATRFGLPDEPPKIVWDVDRALLVREAHDLMGDPSWSWGMHAEYMVPDEIVPWTAEEAEAAFLRRFEELHHG